MFCPLFYENTKSKKNNGNRDRFLCVIWKCRLKFLKTYNNLWINQSKNKQSNLYLPITLRITIVRVQCTYVCSKYISVPSCCCLHWVQCSKRQDSKPDILFSVQQVSLYELYTLPCRLAVDNLSVGVWP